MRAGINASVATMLGHEEVGCCVECQGSEIRVTKCCVLVYTAECSNMHYTVYI